MLQDHGIILQIIGYDLWYPMIERAALGIVYWLQIENRDYSGCQKARRDVP